MHSSPGIDRTAGKRRLAGVRAHRRGPPGEQQIRTVRPVAEQHQHGPAARRRQAPARPGRAAAPAVPGRARSRPAAASRSAVARRRPAAGPAGRPGERPGEVHQCSTIGSTNGAARARPATAGGRVPGRPPARPPLPDRWCRSRRTGTAGRGNRHRRPAVSRDTAAGRGRSPGRRSPSTAPAAAGRSARVSTLTGSDCSVSPQRRTSRPRWVSTVMPGTPNAWPSTTFAVLRPNPGRRHQLRQGARHLAVEPLDERLTETDDRVRLVPEEAGRLDQLLQLRPRRPGVVGRRPEPREHRRGDQVDPHVGGLCRQDRGDRQLERVGEVEFAVGIRVPLRELAGQLPGPTGPRQRSRGELCLGHEARLP